MAKIKFLVSIVVLAQIMQGAPALSLDGDSPDVKLRNYVPNSTTNVAPNPLVKPVVEKPIKVHFWTFSVNTLDRIRSDSTFAKRLARYGWLEKSAEANPAIIEAICDHRSAAKILARHPHIARIAEADPYVCRRITKWPSAARVLAANGNAAKAISRDPEGIYRAIKKDRSIARILAKNPMFDQMVYDNPDLGQYLARFM
ncbi:MAG: hypothetical protein SFY67_00840 [Candidatus Melainabacteria bacterium]|nr:hypothetical protein [Candidatus Melainabacteria bacterium]